MFTIDALDHVALQVQDVERSVRFYTEVLGLTPMPRPAFAFPGAWLRIAGERSLHIIGGAQTAAVSSSRGNHFAITIRSMPEAESHVRAKGIAYTGPHHRPDGALQIYLQDPDGHTIELCVPPA